MKLGKVIGSVNASRKEPCISGLSMHVVRYYDADMRETDTVAACVDTVGAGPGDVVILCSSSSARATAMTNATCTDNAIVGIVETVTAEKIDLYRKHTEKGNGK
jgi:ethanolamine utilization protein EutN